MECVAAFAWNHWPDVVEYAIGEAARRVSAATRALYPALPWRQMIGMRNQVIHMYDGVDVAVVYDTVREDLPPLLEALAGIVDREAR